MASNISARNRNIHTGTIPALVDGDVTNKVTLFASQESISMISSTNDLSVHLLGSHQHKGDDENDLDCDEEEGCMPSCSPKIMYDEDLKDVAATRTNIIIS
jgi:molybdopterin-binding protein